MPGQLAVLRGGGGSACERGVGGTGRGGWRRPHLARWWSFAERWSTFARPCFSRCSSRSRTWEGGGRVVRSAARRAGVLPASEGRAGARLRVQARRNLAAHALGLAQHGGDVRLPRVKIVLVLARVVGAEPLLHGARDGVEEGALPSQVAVAPQQPEALAAEEAARDALNQQRAARLVRERAPRDEPAPSGGHEDRRKRLGGPLGLRLVGEAEEGLLDVGEGVGAEGVVDGGAAAHGEGRRPRQRRSSGNENDFVSQARLGICARLAPLRRRNSRIFTLRPREVKGRPAAEGH